MIELNELSEGCHKKVNRCFGYDIKYIDQWNISATELLAGIKEFMRRWSYENQKR